MQMTMNEEEKGELLELVQVGYKELQAELHHTEDPSFQDILKRRHVVLEELLTRLQGVPASG